MAPEQTRRARSAADARRRRVRGDTFAAGDVVVLIPGIFGFASFGARERIRYFDGAEDVLTQGLPVARDHIHVHKPPPTGSLVRRVRSLHDLIRSLPVSDEARVHLVGHSTGGLDARLLVNRKFLLHGVADSERAEAWDRLGKIVTLSAPMYGTPVAHDLDDDFHFAVFVLVYVAAILDKAGKLRHARVLRAIWDTTLAALRGERPLRVGAIPALIDVLGDQDATAEVVKFFENIDADASLIYDLTPGLMEELDSHIAGGEVLGMFHFVTVAPPPKFRLRWPDEELMRWIYGRFYDATAAGAFTHRVPQSLSSQALQSSDSRAVLAARLVDTDKANDGVVPSGSQMLDGNGASLVLGDHLDVVGHFPSEKTLALFKSGAGFDARAFRALWSDIAAVLSTGVPRPVSVTDVQRAG
jgi:hypothetical protein